ncbi:MAG: hypothetical protein V5A24_01365 [Haloarculaceae archaeon]
MDARTIPRQLWQSIRIAYSDERWLLAGLVAVAIGYPIWVGVTGIAVLVMGDFVGVSLSLDPWTAQTSALAVVLAAFWVVAPGAVATHLVVERLRNPNDNIKTCYRLRHPLALFLLPVIFLVLGVGITVATGSVLGEAVLVLGSMYLAIRAAAYAHRVFALSFPLLAEAILFLALSGFGIFLLATGSIGAGRKQVVVDVAPGIAALVGAPALANYADGVVALGSVDLSMLAATVVVPALLPTLAYVALQIGVSVVQRLRKPNVKRSSLRTGQRYPVFAHPTTGSSAGGGTPASDGPTGSDADSGAGGSASEESAAGGSDAGIEGDQPDTSETPPVAAGTQAAGGGEADGGGGETAASGAEAVAESESEEAPSEATAEDDEVENVGHTRVYSPPTDAADIEMADKEEQSRRGADGTYCPSCDELFEGESRTFCSTCGARLEEP